LREIRHRHAQYAAGPEHAPRFRQHAPDIAPLEMFEYMAVVDEIGRVVRNERQVVDGGDVIDMRVIHRVDVHETGNVPLAAAEMEFHG